MPKYSLFSGDNILVRLVWWAFLVALGCASSVQAQSVPDGAPAAGSAPGRAAPPLGDIHALIVAPHLQTYSLDEGEMPAFLVADEVQADNDGKVRLIGGAQVRRIDSVVK